MPNKPTTIAFANVKGGAGKTTLTITMAVCLHRMGKRVLVVDTDPEETALMWASKASEAGHDDGPPVIRMDGRNLRRDLGNVVRDFDFVLIDTPGNNGPAARAAMLVADLVLLPVTPGGPDWWIFEKTLHVLADARELRPELQARVVFNRADSTTLSKDTGEALQKADLGVLGASIGRRVAIAEAIVLGQGVTDYAPSSEATREVEKFTKAVLKTIRGL